MVFATIERKKEGKGRERETHRYMAHKPRVGESRKGYKAEKLAMWSLECGDVTSQTLQELQHLSDWVGTEPLSRPVDHCWILLLWLGSNSMTIVKKQLELDFDWLFCSCIYIYRQSRFVLIHVPRSWDSWWRDGYLESYTPGNPATVHGSDQQNSPSIVLWWGSGFPLWLLGGPRRSLDNLNTSLSPQEPPSSFIYRMGGIFLCSMRRPSGPLWSPALPSWVLSCICSPLGYCSYFQTYTFSNILLRKCSTMEKSWKNSTMNIHIHLCNTQVYNESTFIAYQSIYLVINSPYFPMCFLN